MKDEYSTPVVKVLTYDSLKRDKVTIAGTAITLEDFNITMAEINEADIIIYNDMVFKNRYGYIKSETATTEPPTPQDNYLQFHNEMHHKCFELTRRKQKDYCSLTGDDPYSVFENFMSPQHDGITDCLTVLRCRLSEKYKRLNVCLNKDEGEIEFETIDDTIEDIINMITLISYYRKLTNDVD